MTGTNFSNIETWRGTDKGFSFKQILLEHLNRCVKNGSQEWHGGYWETKSRSAGGGVSAVEKYYVPDSRGVFKNSVGMFRICLLGYFDSKMKEKDTEIQNKLKEIESSEEKKKKEVIDIHIELLGELIQLLKRLNFLDEEAEEETE